MNRFFFDFSERESVFFVFLYFLVPLGAFFVGLLFLNWHFGPLQLSAVTANSDQLS